MAALAADKATTFKKYRYLELAATASDTYYKGALVGWNTGTNLLMVGQASTAFQPVGFVAEQKTLGAGGGSILVRLFREIEAAWFVNSGTDAISAVGGLAYVEDDQTVAATDSTNTLSVLGRVWKVDSVEGVLVEPLVTAGQRTLSGLDA